MEVRLQNRGSAVKFTSCTANREQQPNGSNLDCNAYAEMDENAHTHTQFSNLVFVPKNVGKTCKRFTSPNPALKVV